MSAFSEFELFLTEEAVGKYADVIVKIHNLPEDHPFTYRVPDHLNIAVGSRVIVPFGTRRLPGYCVKISSTPGHHNLKKIKEIVRVVDEEPLLTEELIHLAAWGAKRYLCAQIDFLEAMIPAGLPAGKTLRAKTLLVAELTAAAKTAKARGEKQKLALALLAEKGPQTLVSLAKKGIGASTVRSLEKNGWVIIKEKKIYRNPLSPLEVAPQEPLPLTQEQSFALKRIFDQNNLQPVLLFGVTGSGKTEVYLQAIAEMMQQGKSSIVLVPEIALTPQMVERFCARFGERVAVLHSRLSAGERFDEWCRIKNNEAHVVIGARSAVFAPVENLGLIILDEEHETSYKQEETPRYHAREVALWRAQQHGAKVVLGSATPSLESFFKAEKGEYELVCLSQRIAGRPLPPVEIVDMRQELKDGNKSVFSRALSQSIAETLSSGRQAIILLNRRGYATFVLCRECGHVMRCPACNVSLKYHSVTQKLCCHYCDHQEVYPHVCPVCGGRYIRHFGTGTQKVAEELLRLFPEARVVRLDADTTARKGQHQKILHSFKARKANVLVGTQMVAKGLDFPHVTLVGVITADTALNLPDFRAGERTFQLLTQVAGRAGRGNNAGKVVVQTYAPDHYAIQAAKNHDYETFYREESTKRKELSYPPYSFFVRLLVSGTQEGSVVDACSFLENFLSGKCTVLGPSPCPLEKVRGRYRWQLILSGLQLEQLLTIGEATARDFQSSPFAGSVRLSLDVEPQSLL